MQPPEPPPREPEEPKVVHEKSALDPPSGSAMMRFGYLRAPEPPEALPMPILSLRLNDFMVPLAL